MENTELNYIRVARELRLAHQKILDSSDDEFHSVVTELEATIPELAARTQWCAWVEADMIRRAVVKRALALANTTK